MGACTELRDIGIISNRSKSNIISFITVYFQRGVVDAASP